MQDRNQVDVLSDQLALQELMNRYAYYADKYDFESWGHTFTEDAVFEHLTLGATFQGRSNIRDAFIQMVRGQIAHTHHIITNCWFEFTGSHTATGHGNLLVVSVLNEGDLDHHLQSGGMYDWEFEKSDRWRIARSRLKTVWQTSTLAPAA